MPEPGTLSNSNETDDIESAMGPLPMTVITGYLGAGKTTLVNAILSQNSGLRITVLVNDFGEISLDETLIANRDGDVIALANGCMCCQIGGDLYRTIDRILALRERIDHLVVETSGVADPSKISQIAMAEPDLDHAGVVTLVDVLHFPKLMEEPRLRDTLERQILKADLVLLTKHEDEAPASVSKTLLLLADLAHQHQVPQGPVSMSALDTISSLFNGQVVVSQHNQTRAEPLRSHIVPFESWSKTWSGTMNKEQLVALLQDPILGIYRAKGRVRLEDGSVQIVNKVGDVLEWMPVDQHDNQKCCLLTVIGMPPSFDKERFDVAWHQLDPLADLEALNG